MAGSTVQPFGGEYIPDHLAQFLSRVVPWSTPGAVPPEGYVNIHYDFPGKPGMPGRAYASLDEYSILRGYIAWLNGRGSNLFFCIAAVADFDGVDARGNRKARRKGAIACSLRSFILDLDVKPKAYPSQEAALAAGRAFCAEHGLTPSFITSSGNGVHIYITLDLPIAPDVWRALASQLATAAQQKGLHADFKVTRNAVSLVRLPWGKNWKDPANPKDCSILEVGPDMTLASVQAAMAAYPVTPEVSRSTAAPTFVLDPAVFPRRPPITHGPDFARVSAELEKNRAVTSIDLLRAACPVVADSDARGGDGDLEPLWFELAKLCHYVQDGRDYFHDLSSGDVARYDEQATDRKYDGSQGHGWPQCKAIHDASPAAAAICQRCAFHGKGQSPLNYATRGLLGTTGAVMPMQATVAPTFVPYVNGAAAFQTQTSVVVDDPIFVQSVQAVQHTVSQGYIFNAAGKQLFRSRIRNIEGRWEPTRNGLEVIRLNVTVLKGTQGDESKNVTFLAGELSSPSGCVAIKNQGLSFDAKNHSAVVEFMDSWVEIVQRQLRMHQEVRLGWTRKDGVIEGFTYGGYIFEPSGTRVAAPPNPNHPLTPRGNLGDWRKAANVYVGKGMVELEIMIATAFAAPLVALTNVEGLIIFARADTGHGKSASLGCSASVWGSRIQIPSSATTSWVGTEIALKNNLPVFFDEAVPSAKNSKSAEKFGEMVLRAASGVERARDNRHGGHAEVRMSQTLLVAAANHSLTEQASSRETSAQAARIFELEFPPTLKEPGKGLPESEVGKVKDALEANYGQAGLVYAEYIGKNHAQVREQVTKAMQFFETQLGLRQAERFWLAAAATLLIGAMISKQLNLIAFDIMSMKKFLLEHLQRLKTTVKDMGTDANDPEVQLARVKDFMNANRNWIITETLAVQGGAPGSIKTIPDNLTHFQHMHGGFSLRLAINDQKLLISERKLREWCERQETVNYRNLHKTLEKHHYCTRSRKGRSLAAGTMLKSATEIVLIFDLSLPCNATLLDEGV